MNSQKRAEAWVRDSFPESYRQFIGKGPSKASSEIPPIDCSAIWGGLSGCDITNLSYNSKRIKVRGDQKYINERDNQR